MCEIRIKMPFHSHSQFRFQDSWGTRFFWTADTHILVLTNNMDSSSSCMVLVPDLVGSTDGLETFHAFALLPHIHVYIFASIEYEAISLVHGSHSKIDLFDSDVPLAFHLEQPFLEGISVYVLETRADSSIGISHSILEVREELLGFVLLDFTILDWGASQIVVQLDAQNCCGAGFIL